MHSDKPNYVPVLTPGGKEICTAHLTLAKRLIEDCVYFGIKTECCHDGEGGV